MRDDRRTRVIVVAFLMIVLCGLLVWAGTLEPDPDRNEFPNENDFVMSYDAYVGDRVQVGGTVVETDPVVFVVTTKDGDRMEITAVSFEADPSVGDEINVYGTLETEQRVIVIDSYTREPWERYYMYAVSFIAGLWVLVRFVRGWRFDRDTFAFKPRTEARAETEEQYG